MKLPDLLETKVLQDVAKKAVEEKKEKLLAANREAARALLSPVFARSVSYVTTVKNTSNELTD